MQLTSEQVTDMIGKLAVQIKISGLHFNQVVGIERGGLHVSVPLAYFLELPHTSVYISHYDGHTPRKVPLIKGPLYPTTGNLIVDDLIDDGKTIKTFDRVFGLGGNEVGVLFWKFGSIKPRFYVAEKPVEWIYFPWSAE